MFIEDCRIAGSIASWRIEQDVFFWVSKTSCSQLQDVTKCYSLEQAIAVIQLHRKRKKNMHLTILRRCQARERRREDSYGSCCSFFFCCKTAWKNKQGRLCIWGGRLKSITIEKESLPPGEHSHKVQDGKPRSSLLLTRVHARSGRSSTVNPLSSAQDTASRPVTRTAPLCGFPTPTPVH